MGYLRNGSRTSTLDSEIGRGTVQICGATVELH